MYISLKIPFENAGNQRLLRFYVKKNKKIFLDCQNMIILAIIIQAHRRETCGCCSSDCVGDQSIEHGSTQGSRAQGELQFSDLVGCSI